MPNAININISLFVHILLDAEGRGLQKVQGNNFMNTVGYFNQYIAQLPKDNHGHPNIPGLKSEKLSVLSAALVDLAKHDNEQNSTRDDQIDDLITQTTQQLLQLKADTDYLLPGGWQNFDGGHAMIYQFRKIPATENSPEKYRFSIYNSGAGLNEHEKLSTDSHEAYVPVKIYEIPTENLNKEQFETFIHHLIVPKFLYYRAPKITHPREPYDETRLYGDIQGIMPSLNDTTDTTKKAQLVSVSTVFPEHFNTLTTPGQISGTCSQFVIYEMLKVNFDDTDNSDKTRNAKRCIFNFQLYALKDFIHQPSGEHPQKRSPGIIKQIELGIITLLTSLQEPNVFETNEQAAFHLELNQLQEKMKTLIRMPVIGARKKQENKNIHDASNNQYEGRSLAPNPFTPETNLVIHSLNIPASLPLFNHPETILSDLQTFLTRCHESAQMAPPDLMWIIDQIDQVINRLPIPSTDQAFQEGIDPYKNLNAEQLKQMEEILENLQALYVKTMTEKAGSGVYPNLHVTQCSFLALHDYCSTQYAKKTFNTTSAKTKPYFYLKKIFSSYFKSIYHSVHIATNNPVFDQRLTHLKNYYLDPQVYNFSLMSFYQDILDTEPVCKAALEQAYKKKPVSDDDFHKALKDEGKEALYYLFESLDKEGNILSSSPLKTDTTTDYSSLCIKIQFAIRMEKTLHQTFSPLMSNPKEPNPPLRIEFNSYKQLEFHSYSDAAVQGRTRHDSFYSNKYNLQKTSIRGALLSHDSNYGHLITAEKKTQSANGIQLESVIKKTAASPSPFNADDFFFNRLQHLRLSPENQIPFTVNDFIENLEKLSDFDHQKYLEANLFEPGLLNDVLKKENFTKTPHSFLTRFDELIQNGFNAYNDNAKNITITSVFFIRLACYVNRYLLDYGIAFKNPALIEIAKTRLTHDLALIIEQISEHEKSIYHSHSTSILASLHHYRFLTLMSLYSEDLIKSLEHLEQCIESFFYCQANENKINPDDKATILERKRVERIFQDYLQQVDKMVLKSMIKKIIGKNLNILSNDLVHFDLTGTYPYYTLAHSSHATEYTVNIEQGLIFKNSRANIPMPLDLQSHPLLKRLGLLDATACYISPDNTSFEFDPIGLRIKREYDDRNRCYFVITIQKKWTVNGKEAWYDLQALTEKQRSEMYNSHNYVTYNSVAYLPSLPHSLKDGESEYWVNVEDPKASFIAKNNQRLYALVPILESNSDKIIGYNYQRVASDNNDNSMEYYLNKASKYHAILSQFESSKDNASSYEFLPPSNFVEVTLAKQPEDKGVAYFSRYGLSFELQDQKITLANTHYSLNIADDFSNNSPFKPEIAQLTLQSEKNQLCIVPVQRFYFDKEKQIDGERNRLTHDVANFIAHDQLTKGPWYFKNERDWPQWHYANSADSIQFPIIDGKPKPNNAADALYLCYLYLGSDESDKAWAVLEDIRTRLPLEGNYREVTYLSWIINALPVMLKGTHNDATLGSPRDVACQLKTLAIYTDFLAQGKKPVFPNKSTLDMTTANGEYANMCLKNVQGFHDNLPNIIYQQYSKFLKIRDNALSEDYALQDTECKSLLNHYHNSLPEKENPIKPNIRGTLGYEYRRLSLKTLVTEQERIKAFLNAQKSKDNILFDDMKKLEKRYASIQQEIDEQCEVMKCETRLEVYPIDLSLPKEVFDNMVNDEKFSSLCTQAIFNKNNRIAFSSELPTFDEKIEGVDKKTLSPNIPEDIFLKHIKTYFFIAANGSSHKSYAILHQFLINYLLAHALSASKKKNSPMVFLVKMLYRVMHKPECLKNADGTWQMDQNLNDIYAAVHDIPVTPLEIRQARDVFETPLKKTQEIVAELREKMPTVKIPRFAMNNVAAKLFKGTVSEVNRLSLQDVMKKALPDNDFQTFCTNYNQAETEYQAILNTLKERLKALDKDFGNKIIDAKTKATAEVETEQLAGQAQFECIEKQRELSKIGLGSPETRIALRAAAVAEKERIDTLLGLSEKELKKRSLDRLNTDESTLWKKAITLANSRLIEKFQIQLDSKKRRLLTKDDLLQFYFDDDLALILEKTQLSPDECQKLRQDIHHCLLLEVQRQQAERLINGLNDLENTSDNITPNAIQLDNIANIFMSKNLSDAANDPVMMLLQYESENREGILLRPRQIDALKNLFETSPDDPHAFNQAVERVIMGGGKSKVLLPLLAQKKASGLNLVIIEVPQALLATNHMDLNATSQKLFNQKAHRFEFNRDSDCSAKRLKEIYELFLDIKTNRDYLVTTGESMQSLQLKYIEILRSPIPENEKEYENWAKQVEWASKLAELLKDHGDVIIDEVHDGLLFKKKLNYTVGLPEALAPVVIQHTLDLYQFMHVLTSENLINPKWLQISQNKEKLIQQFLEHPSSPLKEFAEKLVSSLLTEYTRKFIIAELAAYLMEKSEPAFLLTADPTIQDAFAFYKEQCRLLPQTLDRRYKENYGPSQDDKRTALERTLAIPYAANDKPNERSRFGNALEILNYSTQALLIEGLNPHLLIQLIEDWQTQAREELQKNPGHGTLDNTNIAKKIIKEINHPDFTSLKSIEIKRTQQGEVEITPQIEALLKQVHHNPHFLFTLLENKILPKITTEGAILHSDAINHVSMYHSVQAVSGTPDNHRTFGRLKYNKQASLGTRGYIQQILKQKKTPIHGVDFIDLPNYLTHLYTITHKKQSTHALMDICATFRGKTNLEVAQAIAESPFCKATDEANQKIKFVLYIKTLKINNQESDVLFAYDIKNKKSIRLNSSNPKEINETLDCTPEERFTYYDQIHTTGIDLKQPPQSNGLCLVDEKTKEFFQGAYRMRGLAEQQTVEIIVPTKMTHIPLDNLMQKMEDNEEDALKEDNFYATLAKLNNVIREQALSYIARIDHKNASAKKALESHFESYFIETKISSLWEQYGSIYHEEDTEQLFDQHANKLMEDWNKRLIKLNQLFPEEFKQAQLNNTIIQTDNRNMITSMDEITKKSLPLCHKKALSPQRNNGQEVELQQEAQKEQEQHKEQEKQKEEQAECYGANLQEFQYIPWTLENIDFNVNTRELNTACTSLALNSQKTATPEKSITFFSENLHVSDNYANVFQGQKHFLGSLTKPIHAILFRQSIDPPGSEPLITACIISNQECDEIAQLLKTNPIDGLWIGTTRHDVLAGEKPDNIDINQNQHYAELIEQIQFIDGQCKALVKQKTPFYWLSENTQQKLDYLENKVIPYRETSKTAFKSLKNKLNQKQNALMYINQNSANDLRHCPWQEKFPELSDVDIAMLQKIAIGYHHANHACKNFNVQQTSTTEQTSTAASLFHNNSPTLMALPSKTISTNVLEKYLDDYNKSCNKGFRFYIRNKEVIRNLKKLLREKTTSHVATIFFDEFSHAVGNTLLTSREKSKQNKTQRLVDALYLEFNQPVQTQVNPFRRN